MRGRLFSAERHYDLFVVTSKDYPAILDSLDGDLINLSANLQTKLLAFLHRFAIDDRVMRGAVEGDGADEECSRRNFALIGSAAALAAPAQAQLITHKDLSAAMAQTIAQTAMATCTASGYHVSVAVRDLAAAADFYEVVLGALGFAKLDDRATTVGFGKRYSELWLNHRPDMFVLPSDSGAQSDGVHVCLRAPTTAAVDEFHAAALAAGGASDGAPGLRPHHGDGYYAAFIRDLDGNRIEAVTFIAAARGRT